MASDLRSTGRLALFLAQRASFALLVLVAIGTVVLALLSATGFVPWLEFSANFGAATYPLAGMYTQISLTVLAVMLLFYLPSNARMMALESSHRSFSIAMNDVSEAYATAHAADRKKTFTLASEFDSVRERLAYLRNHPDLANLEPPLLEIAAQMSHVSTDLADVYSKENVERARTFLTQRQQEMERFSERLATARETTEDFKRWQHELELDERAAASQFVRLRDELFEILPELEFENAYDDAIYDGMNIQKVTPIGRKAAE